MSSQSRSLRSTSQTLHGVVLSWAKKAGLYDLQPFSFEDVPKATAALSKKTKIWKTWVRMEIQRKAVVGLYIVDGQLAQFGSSLPSGRHTTNPLSFTSPDLVFDAKTADDWIYKMNRQWKAPATFREVFVRLFVPQVPIQFRRFLTFPHMSFWRGCRRQVLENRDAETRAFGIPSSYQLSRALLNLRESYTKTLPDSIEANEFLLRWHSVCLNLATDIVPLCKKLCAFSGIKQSLLSVGDSSSTMIDLDKWAKGVDARRALLHAIHIQRISERLPMGRAHATLLPGTLFAAAAVYCALVAAHQTIVTSPSSVDWSEVWDSKNKLTDTQQFHGTLVDSASDSWKFVQNIPLFDVLATTQNLRYSLHALQNTARNVSFQWGIAQDILAILQSWTSVLD